MGSPVSQRSTPSSKGTGDTSKGGSPLALISIIIIVISIGYLALKYLTRKKISNKSKEKSIPETIPETKQVKPEVLPEEQADPIREKFSNFEG